MAEVKISITAQTTQAAAALNEFTNRMQNSFGGLASKMATLFSVGAFLRFNAAAISTADEMGKLAQKTGIAVETLSALAYAAELANVQQGELQIGLKAFANVLGDFSKGGKEAVEVFDKMGLGGSSFASLDEALAAIADRFASMSDGIDKTNFAVQLFGRSGQNLIPLLNEGSSGLQKLREEAARAGVIISSQTARAAEEFNDNITRLKANARGFALQLANDNLPRLIELERWLLSNKETISAYGEAIVKMLTAAAAAWGTYRLAVLSGTRAGQTAIIGGGLLASGTAIQELWREYQANQATNRSAEQLEQIERVLRLRIGEFISDMRQLGQLTDEQVEKFEKLAGFGGVENLKRVADQLRGLAGLGGAPGKAADVILREKEFLDTKRLIELRIQENAYIAEKKRLEDNSNPRQRLTDLTRQLELEKGLVVQRGYLIANAKQAKLLNEEEARKLELEDKMALLNIERERLKIRDEFNARIAEDFERIKAAREERDPGSTTSGPNRNSVGDQIGQRLESFNTTAESVAQAFDTVVRASVDSIAQGIEGLITRTQTWGESLRQIGTGILSGVIQAVSKMFAEFIVNMILIQALKRVFHFEDESRRAASLPGKLVDAGATSVSSYGVAAAIGGAALLALLGALAAGAFAEGGRPVPGKPALVGERGPELWWPDQPGTILPNDVTNQFFAAGGGGGGGVSSPDVDVIFVRPEDLAEQLQRSKARGAIVKIVREERNDIGIAS